MVFGHSYLIGLALSRALMGVIDDLYLIGSVVRLASRRGHRGKGIRLYIYKGGEAPKAPIHAPFQT